MTDIIFHHYQGSPFAEKIRRALAYKQLPWRSVDIPITMPRPDLIALTGGYRRVPVMQIGADVFCDSNLMMRILEEVRPEPTFYPPGSDTLTFSLSNWFEPRMFLYLSPARFQGREDMAALSAAVADPATFAKDRGPFMAPLMDTRKMGERLPAALRHLRSFAAFLDRQLESNGDFLCGDRPSHADFSAYHPMAWLRIAPNRLKDITDSERINGWLDRIAAFEGPEPQTMSSPEAVEVAQSCEPDGKWRPADRSRAGVPVTVQPMDYGLDPTPGVFAGEDDTRFSVTHANDRIGTIAVHFPQWGYDITEVPQPD